MFNTLSFFLFSRFVFSSSFLTSFPLYKACIFLADTSSFTFLDAASASSLSLLITEDTATAIALFFSSSSDTLRFSSSTA